MTPDEVFFILIVALIGFFCIVGAMLAVYGGAKCLQYFLWGLQDDIETWGLR